MHPSDFIARVLITTYTLVKRQNRLMTKETTKKVRSAPSGSEELFIFILKSQYLNYNG